MFKPIVTVAVEGPTDEQVAARLVSHAGGQVGRVLGRQGKDYVGARIGGYCQAAHRDPWLVLIDLDADADCPVPILAKWLPTRPRHMCFRVAVREIESWLLADAETLAAYLGVRRDRVPERPDGLADPKEAMISLVRHSRDRRIRRDMVPLVGGGGRTGLRYAARVADYVQRAWRPEVAAGHSESLRRAIACLERIVEVRRREMS